MEDGKKPDVADARPPICPAGGVTMGIIVDEDGSTRYVKSGRGRKPTISAAKAKAIVQAATQTRPAAQTHWSWRTMAKEQGVSPATVQRPR